MLRIRSVVYMLMVLACLLPSSNVRLATAAYISGGPLPLTPVTPIEEEDDSERDEEAGAKDKDRASLRDEYLPNLAPFTHYLGLNLGPKPQKPQTGSPAPLDPFRNGLGSPYRC